jgi:CHAT domain-containing protein
MPTNIKVLFLSANPRTVSRFDVEEEMHAIVQKVRASDQRDSLTFHFAPAARPDNLLQMLNQHRPHIVHFSGNGSEEGLSFVDGDGQVRLVSTDTLTRLFTNLKDNIQLIFLDACYSATQAQNLKDIIGCVIFMKDNLSNEAKIAFASSFYRALGFRRTIKEAFEQGKLSLMLEGLSGDDSPELLIKDGIDPGKFVLVVPPNP